MQKISYPNFWTWTAWLDGCLLCDQHSEIAVGAHLIMNSIITRSHRRNCLLMLGKQT
jgi:hypothetical protein